MQAPQRCCSMCPHVTAAGQLGRQPRTDAWQAGRTWTHARFPKRRGQGEVALVLVAPAAWGVPGWKTREA